MSEILNISEVEFSAIKTNLINYYKENEEFRDFNFEGSGLNLLIDIFAYITHYNAYYLNCSITESFLYTTQLFKNAVLRARDLNYIPRRMTGAEATIDIEVKTAYLPTDPSTVITIPKYTNFSSNSYNFYTTQEYLLNAANSYKFEDVVIRQGVYQSVTFESSGIANQSFEIEDTTVDNDTMEVYVDGTLWENQNNITILDEDSESYQIELTEDSYVKILFGDGILGKIPENGLEIEVKYTTTNGSEGNNYTTFTLYDIVQDQFLNTYDNSKFTVTPVEQSSGGADYETMTSIKANAPKFYESQGRAVTDNDYESILAQHQLVEALNVYNAADDPIDPIFGRVNIAVKPVGALNLTDAQVLVLTSYLNNRNIVGIRPVFVDVRYIYIDISGTIYYKQRYESQLSLVRNTVQNTVTDYFDDMEKFEDVFKSARIVTLLNDLDEIGNTNLTFSPFIYFSKVGTGTYVFQLLNDIVEESVDCDIITGSLNEGFYDDGEGNLLTKKSGNAIIGEVDYENGVVEIYPGYEITATEPDDGFKMSFKTDYDDIHYTANNSITLGDLSFVYTRYV